MNSLNISVFLPAFNEEDNIISAVTSIQNYLKKKFPDYEIIVVNDGSSDKTKQHVEEIIKKDKKVKLINHKKNLGYGAALRSGYKHASKDLIFYTDADNQFMISDFDLLIPYIKDYDIVSGYRAKRMDPLMRIFTALVYNFLINVLFRLGLKDIDASFKVYKRKVFDRIELKSNTGLIDAEVLIKAKKAGFSIKQVPVGHYHRLKGKTMYEIGKRNRIFAFVKPSVIIDILKEMKNLWKELR